MTGYKGERIADPVPLAVGDSLEQPAHYVHEVESRHAGDKSSGGHTDHAGQRLGADRCRLHEKRDASLLCLEVGKGDGGGEG